MDDSHESDRSDSAEHDRQPGAHRVQYNRTASESVSLAVVRTIAALADTRPREVSPLYESIDPDALDGLFKLARDGTSRRNVQVSFVHDGQEVTVHDDGEIVVTPADDD